MARKTQPAEKVKQELARNPHKSQALKMDLDVQAKREQEEMNQSAQEKATEEDNNAAVSEMAIINAEVGGQNDNINNNHGGDGGMNGDDVWELEDINEMEMTAAAAAAAEFYDVRGGGWGEWKHDDGGETWREWEFYAANNNYEENDWVIDDLWVFDDDHHHPNNNKANYNGDAASATIPRDPQA